MELAETKIDSGILQYVPKGAYYEDSDEQFSRVLQMWNDLFNYDRTLFCLITLLKGTGFSKGAMTHMLLGNPVPSSNLPAVDGLSFDYESKVILYNLSKERIPRALKNLLMLTGTEGFNRVNNARTRKLILSFIFDRDSRDLDGLAVNYKGKLKTLVRHALGKQDLFKILNGGMNLFSKWIGRYNMESYPVFCHLFDKEPRREGLSTYFPKIDNYWSLRQAAQARDVGSFRKYMKGMPQRTVMGFRNTYKVPVELAEIYSTAKMTDREKIQLESAAKKSGTKSFKVDYQKQDLYDLWKAFYYKLLNDEPDNMDEIEEAIVVVSGRQKRLTIGECVVIIDASKSMIGSEQRPLHPFITSLCLVSALDDIKDVFYIGGKVVETPTKSKVNVLIPNGATNLWSGLVDAVQTGVENIVVVSDGYENEIKGMFEHTYKHFKSEGAKFNLLHLNPVFSADAKSGTTRSLVEGVDAMPLTDYRFLETEIIFNRMLQNRDMVKSLLVQKYQTLLG
jgi:hypothetical protein